MEEKENYDPKEYDNELNVPLEGHYFHSFKWQDLDGEQLKRPKWQGRVLSKLKDGEFYLVELYEWGMGEKWNRMIVNFHEMLDWNFYETPDDMKYLYEEYERPFKMAHERELEKIRQRIAK